MRKYALRIVLAVVVVAAIYIYYHYDPSHTQWSPKCVMLALTGYKCPGCGTQRMIYHLLHGHVLKAISYNYFASLLIPYLLVLSTGYLAPDSNYTQWVRKHLATKWAAYTYAALYIIWWFLRNLLDL
jgi:hypothetical protein